MNTKNLSLILLISLCLSSCSNFINLIDDELLNKEAIPYKKNTSKQFCESTGKIHTFGESKDAQNQFKSFIAKYQFSFIEKVVLYTFIQMNLRPDLAGPNSHLQVIINNKYYSFRPDKNNYSTYQALAGLLKQYNSKRTLFDLAKIYDSKYPNNFNASKDFADFLLSNKTTISSEPILRRFYMRGDETLKENERIYKQKILPSLIHLKNSSSVQNPKEELTNTNDLICNFNLRQYKNSQYQIRKSKLRSHIFGIESAKDASLIVMTSGFGNIISQDKTIFINRDAPSHFASICLKKFDSKSIWLVSSDSRDPAQSITKLIKSGLFNSTNKSEIYDKLTRPRHLFLEKPLRLVLESGKSNNDELDELYKLNIPLYNTQNLGVVNSYFKSTKSSGFILDNRSENSILCH